MGRGRAGPFHHPQSRRLGSVALVLLVTATTVALVGIPGGVQACGSDATWSRQFGTTRLDEAKAVAVEAGRATYVAGETFGTLPGQTAGGTLDAFVRRYDPAGAEVWTRQFGAWERDIAWGLAVDHLGSVYVVGQSEGSFTAQHATVGWDAFLRKYDASGNEVWTRQFGGRGADIASAVAVDASGAAYVVGTTSSTLPGQTHAGSFDAFVRRYATTGQEDWTRQFGTAAGDSARRVTIDSDGRVLVVGSTEGALPGQSSAGRFDVFLSMLNPDGGALWTRQFGSAGDDFGIAVGTDRDGRISVAGSADQGLSGAATGQSFLRHFDGDGSVLWTEQFGDGRSDDVWDLVVDGEGAIYLVGTTAHPFPGQRSAGRLDAFVRKFSAEGKEVWTRQYGSSEDDNALAVALDHEGGSIAVAGGTRGRLEDHSDGDLDAYVLRVLESGCK